MAEFLTYQSNRIGGTGPNAGLQYNVKAWFPDVPGVSISEDIFADTLQPRVLTQIKILCGNPTTLLDKLIVIRAKPVGTSPSIFSPGVELFRKGIRSGDNYSSATGERLWNGAGDQTYVANNDGQYMVPLKFYMDLNMDLAVNFIEFGTMSIQLHYLTGDPDRLMQAVISS